MEGLEYRAVIKYLNLKGLPPHEIYNEMKTVEGAPSRITIYKWANIFRHGRTSIKDAHRTGRPKKDTRLSVSGRISSKHDKSHPRKSKKNTQKSRASKGQKSGNTRSRTDSNSDIAELSSSSATEDSGIRNDTLSDISQPIIQNKIAQNQLNKTFPTMFPLHEMEILKNLRKAESKLKINPKFMDFQKEIDNKMKSMTVNWMIYVVDHLKLMTETLFSAVSILDRYLSVKIVSKEAFHSIAVVILFMAAKFHEVKTHSHAQFLELIPNIKLTQTAFLQMELKILQSLEFDVFRPNSYDFLLNFAHIGRLPDKTKYLAFYICELTLVETDTISIFYPSIIASSCIALSNCILGNNIWSASMEKITNYHVGELLDALVSLSKIYCSSISFKYEAIKNKFSNVKYNRVGAIEVIHLEKSFFEILIESYDKRSSAILNLTK